MIQEVLLLLLSCSGLARWRWERQLQVQRAPVSSRCKLLDAEAHTGQKGVSGQHVSTCHPHCVLLLSKPFTICESLSLHNQAATVLVVSLTHANKHRFCSKCHPVTGDDMDCIRATLYP